MFGLGVSCAECLEVGRLHVGGRGNEVHEIGHHHAVSLDTHAACSDIRAQQPRAILRGSLSCLDHLVCQVLKHQCVGIAQEAGIGRVRGNLVVEEEAPVVAVRHGQLTVGQRKPVEHLCLHLVVVVHQCVGLPFLFSVESSLEELQCERGLAKLLNDHVLIRGMEVAVVL